MASTGTIIENDQLLSEAWSSQVSVSEHTLGMRRREGTEKEVKDPEAPAPPPLMSQTESLLRRIVLHLFRLDLWSVHTLAEDIPRKLRVANIDHHFSELWISPPPTSRIVSWLDSPELYHSHGIMNLPGFHQYVTGMSYSELEENVNKHAAVAKTYYIRLMQTRTWKLIERKTIYQCALKDLVGSFQINLGLLIGERAVDVNHYVQKITERQSVAEERLASVLNEARVLRDQITKAWNHKALNEDLLPGLRLRVGALHEHYPPAWREMTGDREQTGVLLDQGGEAWLVHEDGQNHNHPPLPVRRPAPSSILATIAFFCSLAASIPTWLCFTSTTPGPGSWTDNNFWSLLAGAFLELLGLGTQIIGPVLLPGTLYTALGRETKTLVWIFGSFTFITTLAAIGLYGTVSAQWSGVLTFAGQAVGSLVQLLLVFGSE